MSEGRARSVLMVLPYLETGGTERHVLALAEGLRGELALGLLAPPGPLLDEFLRLGVRYCAFPRLEQRVVSGIQAFRRGLKELIQVISPDVIHVHAGAELALLVRTVTRDIPVMLTIHAFHGPHADANYRLAARLARLARVERVIAVAESEARRLRDGGLREPTLKVIYNGVPDHWSTSGTNTAPVRPIDWRRELGWPVEAPIVGAVGRLEAPKGFDVLIEAFARLDPADYPAAPCLVVVGDGSERQTLQRQARELGVADRVHFAGFRPDSWRAFGGFDVTVIPSRQDGLPLVCLEAMAAGCPVIASDAGGLPEMVQDGVTGLIVGAENAVALSGSLKTLLKNPALARRMGQAGRARFLEEFQVDRMVARTRAVYDELAVASRRRYQTKRVS
ncbi:MAG TPA: glycosyltransferase family 4 protein [Thermaerobacter sp.]